MLSFERELRELNAPESLLAIERRKVFSVHNELRALAWAGAMLVAAGVSLLVSKNLDRIGPVAVAVAITIAAAGCYAYAATRRGLVAGYIVLLGALLISIDVAYIEVKFKLFDAGWPRHFLILAVVHGITAYVFDSRPVLALSIAALASWIGVEKGMGLMFGVDADQGWRALLASAVVAVWRAADLRFRASKSFESIFEHGASNLALVGGLILTADDVWRPIGLLITLIAAAAVTWLGFRRRSEVFVIYAYVYAVIAIDIVCIDAMDGDTLKALYVVVSTIAAIAGLFALHNWFRRRA